MSGAESEITMIGHAQSASFIFGEVCAYQITWPTDAAEGDEIKLRLTSIDGGVTVYATHGTGFTQNEKLEEV